MRPLRMRVKATVASMFLPGFSPEQLEVHEQQMKHPVAVMLPQASIVPFPFRVETLAPIEPIVAVTEAPKAANWKRLTVADFANLGGPVSKYDANVTAIRLLYQLEAEDRAPTPDEAETLTRYTGWGGLPQAFNLEQKDDGWRDRAADLQTQMSQADFDSARASTNNAHYTPIEVIDAVWAAVRRMGFTGGRVVEPGCGVGYFIGAMPEELTATSQVTAIEVDRVSAAITRKLYLQKANVLHTGFEKATLPDDWFDLAIGNVPFGNFQVADTRGRPYSNFLIHDYFLSRTLDLVRPGGLVAFITSCGTLDKGENRVRCYLQSKADLIGAIRLPYGTFEKMAGTTVATDIIFLQKREPKTLPGTNTPWLDTRLAPEGLIAQAKAGHTFYTSYQRHTLNEFYAARPEFVIGNLEWKSSGFGGEKVSVPVFAGDMQAALAERVEKLPEGIWKPRKQIRQTAGHMQREFLPVASGTVKPGSYVVLDDGRLALATSQSEVEVIHYDLPATRAERIRGLIAIRDCARDLLRFQALSDDDLHLKTHQVALNATYDVFVKKQGPIHARPNRQAFKGDPDLPLLLSLERYDDEAGVADKADIFFKRTVRIKRKATHCDSAAEALAVSIHERGGVDQDLMESLLGRVPADFIEELSSARIIFQNPATGGWETADEYLSGNVRKKLIEAQAACPGCERNVESLTDVQPPDLGPADISARLGSTWIPPSDYELFLNDLLESKNCQVEFSKASGTWSVKVDYSVKTNVANTQVWGTSRMAAHELAEAALNQQVPTIRDRDTLTDKYYVNPEATLEAREKQQAIRDKFREWVFSDMGRMERLVRKYNSEFNAIRLREYNGDHITLPGFSGVVTPHKHQKDAIWRITVGGNTLLAHAVGAGKSLEMIAGGMELRRLGIANKPAFVVPNHMLLQFAAEFMRSYPGANILMATKEDLEGDKRRQLLSRIATGDWDGVLMTHSSFERIKMSDGVMEAFIQDQIDAIEVAILEAKSADRSGNRIIKELEAQKKKWTARLEKQASQRKKDDLLTFEELGIDYLLVDEAHLHKNLWRFTKMTRVAGLPNSNSARAFDMYVKTQHVTRLHGGKKGVVFATGTPVSNSMAELWVMKKFLAESLLEEHGMGMFDAWAANFGESVTALEISPDGVGYRMHTRFAKFSNVPELMALFRSFADVRTPAMLNLPVPKANIKTIRSPASPALKDFVATLVKRAEAIHNGGVSPSEDNMLAVTNDGRRAALDMRLVDPSLPMDPGGKVAKCVENVFEIWQRTADFKGTQLVFCDLSTPTARGRFSVYHEIRAGLVAKGIPFDQVAFIHDFNTDLQKENLFRTVREGKVRVLLGSTSKMGVGTNVQTRVCAIHDLDCPWRPADLEQRDGRGVRQGNLNAEIDLFRYVTEASFDSYSWQCLETKQRFISQVMCGDTSLRSIDDVESTALSYAEIKALASGNPKVLEKAGIDADVSKLSVLKTAWQNNAYHNKWEKTKLPAEISSLQDRIAKLNLDLSARKDVHGPSFRMEIQGTVFTSRSDAGDVLAACLEQAEQQRKGATRKTMVSLGNFAGFGLNLGWGPFEAPSFVLIGQIEHGANNANTPQGLVRVIENAVYGIEDRISYCEQALAKTEKRLADINAELGKPFEHEDRLTDLLKRQREIDAELDLGKNQAGAAAESEAEAEEAVA